MERTTTQNQDDQNDSELRKLGSRIVWFCRVEYVLPENVPKYTRLFGGQTLIYTFRNHLLRHRLQQKKIYFIGYLFIKTYI